MQPTDALPEEQPKSHSAYHPFNHHRRRLADFLCILCNLGFDPFLALPEMRNKVLGLRWSAKAKSGVASLRAIDVQEFSLEGLSCWMWRVKLSSKGKRA